MVNLYEQEMWRKYNEEQRNKPLTKDEKLEALMRMRSTMSYLNNKGFYFNTLSKEINDAIAYVEENK